MIITAILGAVLGFMPGISQALGLIVVATFLLLILNTNLTLAFLIGLGAKLIAWTLAPFIFSLGRFLLDGPAQGVFAGLINAPVYALFGFEYYAVTGGLLAGLIFGLVVGILLAKTVVGFRTKMATMEANSAAFAQMQKKILVKVLFFCLSGGLPKDGFAALQEKSPSTVRVSGVVATVVLSGAIYGSVLFANGPIAASIIKNSLERANGATVDLASLELELQEGRMVIHQLAMADPNALETDLFRAETISVDIRASDLLRKRVNLEKVEISAASNGLMRQNPGSLVGPKMQSKSNTEIAAKSEGDGVKGLDAYMKDAKVWKQRLTQAKRWVDKLSGVATKENKQKAEEVMTTAKPSEEELDEWLDQQIMALGYGKVVASHLIQGSPSLQIEKLIAKQVTTTAIDETLDIQGFNLSTQPHLAAGIPRLEVKSSGKTLDLDLSMGGVSKSGGDNKIKLLVQGLLTDMISGQLSASKPLFSGGTFDVVLNGAIENRGGAYINIPLKIFFHDTNLTVSDRPVPLKFFELPITVRGPMDNPGIIVDQKALTKAFAKAGKGMVKDRLKKELDKKLKGKAGGILDKVGGGGGGFKLPF